MSCTAFPSCSTDTPVPVTARGNEFQVLTSPGEAWEVMYADCAAAQKSIFFEQYIIANDEVGQRFFALFIAKAKEGLRVRLILDSIGSRAIENSSLPQALRDVGGEVLFYNPKNWTHLFSPSTWFPRNHAKTMLVDEQIAFVGSVCLDATMRDWRDMHLRLKGPIVDDIKDDFGHLWLQMQAHSRSAYRHYTLPIGQKGPTRYAVHRPELKVNGLYRELLTEIGFAKEHIRLATPYFVPPLRLRAALRAARRRNVKVTILLSDSTDVPLADRVGRSYFPKLVRMGIKLRLYTPSVMHAKYAIIDGRWATIGSTNLDYLSLLRNRETNLITREKPFIEALLAQFNKDTEFCHEGTVESWTQQPLLYRLIGRWGRILRHIM